MKPYSEKHDFYPDGYATLKGRPLTLTQIFLSERCLTTNEGHWWVKKKDGAWEHIISTKAATLAVVQNWVGSKGHDITPEDVAKFMKSNAPVVRGALPVPDSSAPGIEFQGSLFINTWRDSFLPPCPEALTDRRYAKR